MPALILLVLIVIFVPGAAALLLAALDVLVRIGFLKVLAGIFVGFLILSFLIQIAFEVYKRRG